MSDWKADVFKQKSLSQVYRASATTFPRSVSNIVILLGFICFGVGFTIWGAVYGQEYYTVNESADLVHEVANGAFVLALSILGFLVAGFSIFASVTKVDLFILLAQLPYKQNKKETGLSRLQFIFFNFLNVFSIYLGLLALCLFITLGFSDHSPIARISASVSSNAPKMAMTANFFMASVLMVWLVDALLQLKAFIWNLYQAVLLSIVTEAELFERKAQEELHKSDGS